MLIFPLFGDPLSSPLRDSAVGIATGYGLDDRGVEIRVLVESRMFSSPYRPDRLWAHLASYQIDTWGSFPGVKWPGREADHSPPTSAEVKKTWINILTTPLRLYGVVLN
jgi:hypothetical protein